MLFPADLHGAIRAGTVTVAFRRWRRPTVVRGGTIRTPAGLLAIDDIEEVGWSEIGDADLRRAGLSSLDQLAASLPEPGDDRRLYRIRFHRVGDDPRIALREDADLTADDRAELADRLGRWDAADPTGGWTHELLALIGDGPGRRSADLARCTGVDQATLKRRVRRLKELGLTESLDTGYRLSPRGRAYLGDRPDGRVS